MDRLINCHSLTPSALTNSESAPNLITDFQSIERRLRSYLNKEEYPNAITLVSVELAQQENMQVAYNLGEALISEVDAPSANSFRKQLRSLALECFQTVIKNPQNLASDLVLNSHSQCAIIFYSLRNFDRALQSNLDVLAMQPNNLSSLKACCRLYLIANDTLRAEQYAWSVIDKTNEDIDAFFDLAECYSKRGNHQDAIAVLRGLPPSSKQAERLALSLLSESSFFSSPPFEQTKEALALFRSSIELPASYSFVEQIIRKLRNFGLFKESIEFLNLNLTIKPLDCSTSFQLLHAAQIAYWQEEDCYGQPNPELAVEVAKAENIFIEASAPTRFPVNSPFNFNEKNARGLFGSKNVELGLSIMAMRSLRDARKNIDGMDFSNLLDQAFEYYHLALQALELKNEKPNSEEAKRFSSIEQDFCRLGMARCQLLKGHGEAALRTIGNIRLDFESLDEGVNLNPYRHEVMLFLASCILKVEIALRQGRYFDASKNLMRVFDLRSPTEKEAMLARYILGGNKSADFKLRLEENLRRRDISSKISKKWLSPLLIDDSTQLPDFSFEYLG